MTHAKFPLLTDSFFFVFVSKTAPSPSLVWPAAAAACVRVRSLFLCSECVKCLCPMCLPLVRHLCLLKCVEITSHTANALRYCDKQTPTVGLEPTTTRLRALRSAD